MEATTYIELRAVDLVCQHTRGGARVARISDVNPCQAYQGIVLSIR